MSTPRGLADRERIESILPHRAPFLFVDRIVGEDLGGETPRLVTEFDVAPELDCFRGHYPGEPVLPGVLMTEFAAQSGALLVYLADPSDREADGVPVMTRIEDARFRRIVRPGETLRAEVELAERLSNARYMKIKIQSSGQLVARIRLVLAVAPKASLNGGAS